MEISLQNKVVCVTGSARRVGRTIALAFAEAGAHVVIHHHQSPTDAQETAQLARQYGVDALICQADQSQPDEIERLFGEIKAHYGRLDILVNSAANFMQNKLLDISYEEWQTVLNVNLTGPFLCTQQAAQLMIEQGEGGTIINISDNSGRYPWKGRPHHSIAKSGVLMLTEVSALSLGEHDIRVNAVVPGPVLKPPQDSVETWEKLGQRLPLKRTGSADDVARACLFLAKNTFITGSILGVDGGEFIATR